MPFNSQIYVSTGIFHVNFYAHLRKNVPNNNFLTYLTGRRELVLARPQLIVSQEMSALRCYNYINKKFCVNVYLVKNNFKFIQHLF
jgi:hypothetical protein